MISHATEILIRNRFLQDRAESARPTVYCMAGIPGAGKSTYVQNALRNGTFPQNAFLLDPDRVMQSLPEYQADLMTHGAAAAFTRWEMPARELAYDMLENATIARMNIIKDMGCARMENYEKLKSLKQSGYRLHMVHVSCPVDEALRRAALRERHTPPDMIRERATALQTLLPLYRELADEFVEYISVARQAA